MLLFLFLYIKDYSVNFMNLVVWICKAMRNDFDYQDKSLYISHSQMENRWVK